MTVSEIKGIENKYIITYNIFSDFHKQWQDIFAQLHSQKKLKSELYRYYFNLVYVSITRARDYLGMVEDHLPEAVHNWLIEKVDMVYKFDIKLLNLDKRSTEDDLLKNALELEREENLLQAIATYKRVIEKGKPQLRKTAEKGIKRCEIKIKCFKTKDYIQCGLQLLELEEYEEAITCFRRDKYATGLLKAILLSNNDHYDPLEEMAKLNTNPLEILVEINDEQLTKIYLNNEIEPMKHQYRNLKYKSNELLKKIKNYSSYGG